MDQPIRLIAAIAVACAIAVAAAPAAGARTVHGTALVRDAAITIRADADYPTPHPGLKAFGTTLQAVGAVGLGLSGKELAGAGVAALTGAEPVAGAVVVASGVTAVASAGLIWLGNYLYNYYKDPVSFNFKKIATPAVVTVRDPVPSSSRYGAVGSAETNLLQAIVNGYELAHAFHLSLDRAAGAVKRHAHKWVKRQLNAAVGYAHRAAGLLGTLSGLQGRLAAASSPAGVDVSLRSSGGKVDRAKLRALFAQYGIGRFADLILKSIADDSGSAKGGETTLTGVVDGRTLVKHEHAAAVALKDYSRALVTGLIAAA